MPVGSAAGPQAVDVTERAGWRFVRARATVGPGRSGPRWPDGAVVVHDLAQRLDGGAPGIHLYTFNRVRPALDVISHLRLGGILTGSSPDTAVQREVRRDYLNATPGGDRGPSGRMPGAARS